MDNNYIVPVIMAGGSGTRLWPLSRSTYPKQFLKLIGEATLLQETIARLDDIPHDRTIIMSNEDYRFIVAEQLRTINYKKADIILEPEAKNTAPAIALSAFHALSYNKNAILVVLAADHYIENKEKFSYLVAEGVDAAIKGYIVTFGVVPNKAETGYGYIRSGDELDKNLYKIDSFVEKPSLEKAEQYLKEGTYFWNSGMFVCKASTYLHELKKFAPDIHSACEKSLLQSQADMDFLRVDADAFNCSPKDSIDYAVMEHTERSAVIPFSSQWSDVGSWLSLWETSEKDESGNAKIGDVICVDSANNYMYSSDSLVTLVGVENLAVVQTQDALLVASLDKVQNVKAVVEELNRLKRKEHILHTEVFRPWGSIRCYTRSNNYIVNKIVINPGAGISQQYHHHRAEHWIVVKGTAYVTKGDKKIFVTENESTYIPIGVMHSIKNNGRIPLEVIEIQSGSYLEEDDIYRD
ncbi:mannose-1-phosphate guanylyltransferase/mannose-6-phosphate isomerase [Enterobacter quasimori]|uniref:mannose-1-phosphate guanylyltransferase/mannose-6-phosphate isomerase n=1 Tax=Enterobacter quasimori TaxID=2838947 RepID=UPI001C0CB33D|nr:mannose-1-phosphate guanylyltransferase/mannose-6-phosphate isomerase [Enterobacter quasimori]MBT1728452.1 mannose-1-phosphate guanylyltransferase/mannose-6-phosphate isomerase [Enterobacter quasimori]